MRNYLLFVVGAKGGVDDQDGERCCCSSGVAPDATRRKNDSLLCVKSPSLCVIVSLVVLLRLVVSVSLPLPPSTKRQSSARDNSELSGERKEQKTLLSSRV